MEQIRKIRKQKGLTQEQLALAVGVKRSVISKYENGTISPSVNMLKAIADALDVHASVLYGEKQGTATYRTDHVLYMGGRDMTLLLNAYDRLNFSGKKEAVKRVEELTEIHRYNRYTHPDPVAPPPPAPEGTDTTPAVPPPESAENGQ